MLCSQYNFCTGAISYLTPHEHHIYNFYVAVTLRSVIFKFILMIVYSAICIAIYM